MVHLHELQRALDRSLYFVKSKRLTGKGDLTRKRTIVGTEDHLESGGFKVLRDVDSASLRGRVLSVHGLSSVVLR